MTKTKTRLIGLDRIREVRRLRSEIEGLTDRAPDSDNPRYLAQRLADLQKRIADGEDVKHRSEEHAVMSISMPVAARDAVDRILESEPGGVSALMRKALAFWATRHGYKTEASEIEGGG